MIAIQNRQQVPFGKRAKLAVAVAPRALKERKSTNSVLVASSTV